MHLNYALNGYPEQSIMGNLGQVTPSLLSLQCLLCDLQLWPTQSAPVWLRCCWPRPLNQYTPLHSRLHQQAASKGQSTTTLTTLLYNIHSSCTTHRACLQRYMYIHSLERMHPSSLLPFRLGMWAKRKWEIFVNKLKGKKLTQSVHLIIFYFIYSDRCS